MNILCFFSLSNWRKFSSSKITIEFVECLSKWEEYGDGFIIWRMFKVSRAFFFLAGYLYSSLFLHFIGTYALLLSLSFILSANSCYYILAYFGVLLINILLLDQ